MCLILLFRIQIVLQCMKNPWRWVVWMLNLLNFTCHTMKFHKCHYTSVCMYVHDLTRVYVLPSVCMKEEQKRFVVVSSHYVCNYQKQNCSPDLLLSSSICNAHILLQNYRELTSRGSRWLLAPTNLVIYWTLKQQFFKSFYGPACIFSCEKSYILSR